MLGEGKGLKLALFAFIKIPICLDFLRRLGCLEVIQNFTSFMRNNSIPYLNSFVLLAEKMCFHFLGCFI